MDNLENEVVKPYLPGCFGGNEYVPEELNGATIKFVGTFENQDLIQGGGLVIDYVPSNQKESKRIILEFTSNAMWVSDSG